MHSNTTYALFWKPATYPTDFPAGYRSLIDTYFSDVAGASGASSNVYASDTQYYDNVAGTIAYRSSFGGSFLDTQPYPTIGGCVDQNQPANPCLTDAQLQAELSRFVAANGLPSGIGAIYFIFTPPGVSSCDTASLGSCSFSDFCAYHNNTSTDPPTTLVYTDQPFTDLSGCGSGEAPNNDPAADSQLNVISHEHNESITDPIADYSGNPTGWADSSDNEDGDKCAFDFGAPIGGPSGQQYNQVINGHHYWLQQEWSNADSGCVQTYTPAPSPPPSASSPGSGSAGAATGAGTTTTASTPAPAPTPSSPPPEPAPAAPGPAPASVAPAIGITFLPGQRVVTASRHRTFSYAFAGTPPGARARISFVTARRVGSRRRRSLELGTGTVTLAPDGSARMTVRLTRAVRVALKRNHRLLVRVTITIGDRSKSARITVRAPHR